MGLRDLNQEQHYWDRHYRDGGMSGRGSIGGYRKWKWKVIKQFVNIKEKTVLDVGCGDLSFLKGKKFKQYLGFDISDTIIKRNRKERPDLKFVVKDVTEPSFVYQSRWDGRLFDVVLCMDLLFHIMTDEGFENLLKNLNRWAGEWLFLINWCENPLPYRNDHYQYFRDILPHLNLMPDLKLIGAKHTKNDPYNMLYLFKRPERKIPRVPHHPLVREMRDWGRPYREGREE